VLSDRSAFLTQSGVQPPFNLGSRWWQPKKSFVHSSIPFIVDGIAIFVLVVFIYFPRYRRRDLALAYIALNAGVLAVSQALSSVQVSFGLGLGLFGVLSIIRLRSAELDQSEIAYYFKALSLGLLGGLEIADDWLGPALTVALVALMYIFDHPRMFNGYRRQVLTIDQAIPHEDVLIARAEEILGASIHSVKIRRTDLVNDTTVAEVRCRLATPTVPARQKRRLSLRRSKKS
jgi:hypothetical protein